MGKDEILDAEVMAGLLADMDRIIDQSGCSYVEAAALVGKAERLSQIEYLYMKLSYEKRMAGEVH